MLLWAPHSNLYDEDLFPRFGMNVKQFHQRFGALVPNWRPTDSALPTVNCSRARGAISDTGKRKPVENDHG
jgi:hypothetical protein